MKERIKPTLFALLIFPLAIVLPLDTYADKNDVLAKDIEAGSKLYQQSCIFCHQADAIGKPGMAPSLSNPEFLSVASDEFLHTTISKGRSGTGMPPFSYLGDEKISSIITYLRSYEKLKNISAKVDAQPDAHGDPRLGLTWFNDICATCHGPEGNGYLAGGTGTAIGSKSFLDTATDGFIRETIKRGRSNTRMKAFQGHEAMADLSDNEIDDIITYMRTLSK